MIVIYRNGVPTVVTGWRAWLIMLGAALAFVVITGLVLGVPRGNQRPDSAASRSSDGRMPL